MRKESQSFFRILGEAGIFLNAENRSNNERCTVKFVIGIYQEKGRIEQHLDALKKQHHDIMEVGPFASKSEAEGWMEYMGSRLQPNLVERFTVGNRHQNIWFGATFAAD